MHRTHGNSDFLQVFAMVICLSLLLVPQMSSAGGLGDLFPSDIVDKIKSTDLKDIFRPSDKSEKTSDTAPKQDSAPPAATVAETTVEPVKASTPPPAVAASPAVAKEAEEVKAWCYKKASVRIQNDCECVARKFQDGLLAETKGNKESLRSLILDKNQCPNAKGFREFKYKQCVQHNAFNQDTGGHDPEAYCQCYGRRNAEILVSNKGRRVKTDFKARMYCKKPEAYK